MKYVISSRDLATLIRNTRAKISMDRAATIHMRLLPSGESIKFDFAGPIKPEHTDIEIGDSVLNRYTEEVGTIHTKTIHQDEVHIGVSIGGRDRTWDLKDCDPTIQP